MICFELSITGSTHPGHCGVVEKAGSISVNDYHMGQKIVLKSKGPDWRLISAVCRCDKSFNFSELLFPHL